MIEDDRLEQVLRARAEQLAKRKAPVNDSEQSQLVVVVALGNERLAIPAERLFRILPHQHVSRFPGTPNWCAGVFLARGQLITVVDLDVWLGAPQASAGETLAIVEGSQGMLALLVGEVLGLRRIAASELTNHFGTGPFLALTHDLVSLLDVDALFASARIHTGMQLDT